MREKDELAKTLETIEKKAKLAIMKDQIGIDEINNSTDKLSQRFNSHLNLCQFIFVKVMTGSRGEAV